MIFGSARFADKKPWIGILTHLQIGFDGCARIISQGPLNPFLGPVCIAGCFSSLSTLEMEEILI